MALKCPGGLAATEDETLGVARTRMWMQKTIRLRSRSRGCHLITDEILSGFPELARCRVGLLHIFLQHTSASLTINENADPDVRHDLESALNSIAPEDFPYRHTIEGADDMPAHV